MKEEDQIYKIRDEKGDITTNNKEIWRNIREYFENLYSSKLENLYEIDKIPRCIYLTKIDTRRY
jgi:hypothetical protein